MIRTDDIKLYPSNNSARRAALVAPTGLHRKVLLWF